MIGITRLLLARSRLTNESTGFHFLTNKSIENKFNHERESKSLVMPFLYTLHLKKTEIFIFTYYVGFGISGTPEEVVHQWYNIIRSIIESGMTLTSTKNDEEPKIFMSQPDLFHSSCCYYLTFSRL
jgi:hypothetical protein